MITDFPTWDDIFWCSYDLIYRWFTPLVLDWAFKSHITSLNYESTIQSAGGQTYEPRTKLRGQDQAYHQKIITLLIMTNYAPDND